jgi:hypothetical protein
MGILLLPSTLFGLILILVFHSSRRKARAGGGEEAAHAAALQRRHRAASERRREPRQEVRDHAKASVLGGALENLDCRIVNVSRSGMRITLPQPVPIGAQLNVAWGSEFFVGTVCYAAAQHGQHVIGLQMICSSR